MDVTQSEFTNEHINKQKQTNHQNQSIHVLEQPTIIHSKSTLEEPDFVFSSTILGGGSVLNTPSLVTETYRANAQNKLSKNHSSNTFTKQGQPVILPATSHISKFHDSLSSGKNKSHSKIQKSASNVSGYWKCF